MESVSLVNVSSWALLAEQDLLWKVIIISLIAIFAHTTMDSCFLDLMFPNWKRIPIQGSHLEKLETIDIAFVNLNKLLTAPFALQFLQYVFTNPRMRTAAEDATVMNVWLPFVLLILIDDLGYYLFHASLHHKWVYKYIHKHHHRSHAPSRGNWDGLNAHPLEYVCSAYMHLWSLMLLNSVFGVEVHCYGALGFVAIGAFLGALNHSRIDVRILGVYAAVEHDAHHRIPDTNFGQYTKVWDVLFGTYVPFIFEDEKKE